MVIWLIGMSASGKTTIARELIKILKSSSYKNSWVLLDGDTMRNIMGEDLGHTVEDRKKNANRLCNFCSFLDNEGVNVLACVLSIFHESQDWLRDNIRDYRQVYLKVNLEILKKRDNKDLYRLAESGKIDNVVGVDIPFPEPKNSDFILENNADGIPPVDLAKKVIDGLKLNNNYNYKYNKQDLIEHPISYQYLPYEGEIFIGAYKRDREDVLDNLKERIHEYFTSNIFYNIEAINDKISLGERLILPIEEILPGDIGIWRILLANELMPEDYQNRFLNNKIDFDNVLITREFLLNELSDIENRKWSYVDRISPILKLLQRFEVSKKVYTHYKLPNISIVKREYSDLINFLLFHILLSIISKQFKFKESLSLQNGMLKLGDIISSIIYRLISPGQLILAYICIRNELKFLQNEYGI